MWWNLLTMWCSIRCRTRELHRTAGFTVYGTGCCGGVLLLPLLLLSLLLLLLSAAVADAGVAVVMMMGLFRNRRRSSTSCCSATRFRCSIFGLLFLPVVAAA
jgi:hypothetical protein